MSQLGWGMGFENVQKALAMMLAQRQQDAADVENKRRYEQSYGLDKERVGLDRQQLADATTRFNTTESRQADEFNRTFDASAGQTLWQRQQAEAAQGRLNAVADSMDPKYGPMVSAGMTPFDTPDQKFERDRQLEGMRQGFDVQQNNATRQNQLEIARLQNNGRTDTTTQQFWKDFRDQGTRLTASPDMDEAGRVKASMDFLKSGRTQGIFNIDQGKTHDFITPGVDPFVRSRFGGDYDAAATGLGSDPNIYAELIKMGIDPDVVRAAVMKSQADYKQKQGATKRQELINALRSSRPQQQPGR